MLDGDSLVLVVARFPSVECHHRRSFGRFIVCFKSISAYEWIDMDGRDFFYSKWNSVGYTCSPCLSCCIHHSCSERRELLHFSKDWNGEVPSPLPHNSGLVKFSDFKNLHFVFINHRGFASDLFSHFWPLQKIIKCCAQNTHLTHTHTDTQFIINKSHGLKKKHFIAKLLCLFSQCLLWGITCVLLFSLEISGGYPWKTSEVQSPLYSLHQAQ